MQSVALIGTDGSVDWLCLPRFDSEACFAALLGNPEHGRWLIAPADTPRATSRRYRRRTLILETEFETAAGAVCVIDFLSRRDGLTDLVPWVTRQQDRRLRFTAGAHSLYLDTPVPLQGE